MKHPTIDAYKIIRDRIIGGELPPGTSLIEMDLAAQYGISRSTIKKVLLMLENENLVTIEPNKGAKVKTYTLEEVLESMQVREILEGYIAGQAAETIDEAGLAQMRDILAEMHDFLQKRDLLSYSAGNKRFHKVIYSYCPNRTAVEMTQSLRNQISKYGAKTILIPGRDECSYKEHCAILEALEAHDAPRAERITRAHIGSVARMIQEYDRLLF